MDESRAAGGAGGNPGRGAAEHVPRNSESIQRCAIASRHPSSTIFALLTSDIFAGTAGVRLKRGAGAGRSMPLSIL